MAGTGTPGALQPITCPLTSCYHHWGFQRHLFIVCEAGVEGSTCGCCPLLCEGDLGVQQLCLALCDTPREGDVSNPRSCFKCHSIPHGTSQKTKWTASIKAK